VIGLIRKRDGLREEREEILLRKEERVGIVLQEEEGNNLEFPEWWDR